MANNLNDYNEKKIVGVFDTEQEASRAIGQLQSKGIPSSEISVITRDRDELRTISEETGTKAPEGVATGAATGGVVGGVAGLLAGIVLWLFQVSDQSSLLDLSRLPLPEQLSEREQVAWSVDWSGWVFRKMMHVNTRLTSIRARF